MTSIRFIHFKCVKRFLVQVVKRSDMYISLVIFGMRERIRISY